MAKRSLTLAVDPRAVSWQVMVASAITLLLFGDALGFAVIAITWPLLALAHRSVLRLPFARRHPSIGILVTFGSVAVASWVTTTAVAGEQSVLRLLPRTGAVLLLTAAWASIDDYRRGLAEERALQAALARARSAGAQRVQAQRDDVISQVSGMLEATLADVDDTMAASGRLRELARERIRPLSHELARALPPYEPERPSRIVTRRGGRSS